MIKQESELLELLISHELAIKNLYLLFAGLFPGHTDFWTCIAQDEQTHSEWLECLRSKKTLGEWFLSMSRLKQEGIETSIAYVEKQTARAREGNFSLLEALSISRDLENALIEKQFSEVNESVPVEIRSVFMDLLADTERHRKIFTEALEAEKRRKN
ncbi:hypothetical protein JXA40_03775 [bacterium]|nr:hypothetical protein [candidate division CSSED10-310 bacterium]